jgi:hypothetical protein
MRSIFFLRQIVQQHLHEFSIFHLLNYTVRSRLSVCWFRLSRFAKAQQLFRRFVRQSSRQRNRFGSGGINLLRQPGNQGVRWFQRGHLKKASVGSGKLVILLRLRTIQLGWL